MCLSAFAREPGDVTSQSRILFRWLNYISESHVPISVFMCLRQSRCPCEPASTMRHVGGVTVCPALASPVDKVHLHMYIYAYVHIRMWCPALASPIDKVHLRQCVCIHIYIYIYTPAPSTRCTCGRDQRGAKQYQYIHTYIYIYTYAYTQTHLRQGPGTSGERSSTSTSSNWGRGPHMAGSHGCLTWGLRA